MQCIQDDFGHGELRKCKYCRESSLSSRQVDYINQFLIYRCQYCCLRDTNIPVIFYSTQDQDDNPNTSRSEGREMIIIVQRKYRMNYGLALRYDPLG